MPRPPKMTPLPQYSDAVLARLMSLHPKVIDLTLERVERLLVRLGHPENSLPPVVHVSGTNGKGSVIAFMRAALEAAGKRVHVYTSPHLVWFRERIRVAGDLITDEALTALLEECERVNGGEPITFFEITTCAAFLAFARTPADVLILETGLGGRLDATNLVDRPALTVITEISLDHQQFLGDTIEEIAFEKAGILKHGVPCILARQTPEVAAVIARRAQELNVPLICEGIDWQVAPLAGGFTIRKDGLEQYLPGPNLPGAHQLHNAAVAVQALEALAALPGFEISGPQAARGLQMAEWPARFQHLHAGPLVEMLPKDIQGGWELWLDGGHNEAAAHVIADEARAWSASGDTRPLHLIFGMLNSKQPEAFLAPLKEVAASVTTVEIPGEENALPADELARVALEVGHNAHAAPDVATALRQIIDGIDGKDGPARVLICGSLYLAGGILAESG